MAAALHNVITADKWMPDSGQTPLTAVSLRITAPTDLIGMHAALFHPQRLLHTLQPTYVGISRRIQSPCEMYHAILAPYSLALTVLACFLAHASSSIGLSSRFTTLPFALRGIG
jgi:hypothetical protein